MTGACWLVITTGDSCSRRKAARDACGQGSVRASRWARHLGATVLSAFPALAARHHGAHTVLTALLDRPALYGVLTEIEAFGLDLLELRQLTRTTNHRNQGERRHRDGR